MFQKVLKLNSSVDCSLAVDESPDITSTSCAVTSDFEAFEELADLHSKQGTYKGIGFYPGFRMSHSEG
jgi:hypothetical protein